MPLFFVGDFGTICKPGTKWEPELIPQVPHTSLLSKLFTYVWMTTEIHQWDLHGGFVTLVQSTGYVQNEDQI